MIIYKVMFGVKVNLSDEARRKISHKSKGKNNPMYGVKHDQDAREKMRLAWAKRKQRVE